MVCGSVVALDVSDGCSIDLMDLIRYLRKLLFTLTITLLDNIFNQQKN